LAGDAVVCLLLNRYGLQNRTLTCDFEAAGMKSAGGKSGAGLGAVGEQVAVDNLLTQKSEGVHTIGWQAVVPPHSVAMIKLTRPQH
jgi:hypothetical protein